MILLAQMAVAGVAVAGGPAQLRAHQRQRQLTGQQFVEGEPRPERAVGQDIGQLDRHMDAVAALRRYRRKFAAADHLRADPFRQFGQLLQRLRHRAPQRAQRQALGEGIDGIDARELCKARFIDDAVGMDDLQHAVVHLHGAGDVALGADRQQLLDIARLGAEIGQHHVAGVVAGIDQMRRARIARRRRPMPVDGHLQRHHGSRHRVADFRPRPAVDHARRQMQQQIDQPRRLVAAEQIAEQLVLLRPDAGKARDRRKQRIEQSRAHPENLRPFQSVMPGFMPGIHGFFRRQRLNQPRMRLTYSAEADTESQGLTPQRWLLRRPNGVRHLSELQKYFLNFGNFA